MNDISTIKELLFTRQGPAYSPPVQTNGYKVYSCLACGDRYLLETNLEYHLNRRSLKITFGCQYCHKTFVFYNRCNFIRHLRAHAFKTTTVNLPELFIESLPINEFPEPVTSGPLEKVPNVQIMPGSTQHQTIVETTSSNKPEGQFCSECGKNIPLKDSPQKNKVNHYMEYNNEQMFKCPICFFVLPTTCALKIHLRIHYEKPPNECPECGVTLDRQSLKYPFSHGCKGFQIIRATTRVKCPVEVCSVAIHPSDYGNHMKKNHLKVVFKCPKCVVACFTEASFAKHVISVHIDARLAPTIYYQCQLCPGRLVLYTQVGNHIKQHNNDTYVYPCWACGRTFDSPKILEEHSQNNCPKFRNLDYVFVNKKINPPENTNKNACNKAQVHSIKAKNQINVSTTLNASAVVPNNNSRAPPTYEYPKSGIICSICKKRVNENWGIIKNHYKKYHKGHRCLDIVVLLERVDLEHINMKIKQHTKKVLETHKINKTKVKKSNETCSKSLIKNMDTHQTPVKDSMVEDVRRCRYCDVIFENKGHFKEHLVSHRDPYSAYQCLECGISIATKSSFSMHLKMEHGIFDTENYIENNIVCYNEEAFIKRNSTDLIEDEPVAENQCKICREQFSNEKYLEKHIRVHGMAFLMTNKLNKT